MSLSLGRVETARRHLQAAWDGDYRPPEVAYALGLTYGRLYQSGLNALEGETNADQRQARKAELQRAFRDPAVRFLGLGDDDPARPGGYGDALIAYYEGELARARELAKSVAEQSPWLYEASVLIGDAWKQEGNELRDAGEYEAALEAYDRARVAFGRAAAVGESDPVVYVRQCALATDNMQLHLYGPAAETAELFERGRAACANALAAHPSNAEALGRQARLLLMQGRLADKKGAEPADFYKRAAEAGERAAELDPDAEAGLMAAGTAYQQLADLATERSGRDPSDWLGRAAGVYSKALDANPDNPDIYNELGNIHAIRGEYLEFYTNEDPMPDYRQAERYYEEALRRRPDSPYIHNNQGILFADIAGELRVAGGDPVPWFDKAIASYRRAIELKPDHTFAFNNLGIAYVERARHAEEVYDDPMPWLDRAVATLEQAVALRADYRNGWHNLGRAHLNRLQELSARGQEPGQAANAALEAFRRAQEQRPSADSWLNVGNTHLALARHESAAGRDPEPDLDAAWKAFEEALALVPNHTHALGNRWDVWIIRARHELSRGRDARPAAQRAIEGLTALTERFPDNYEPREKLSDAWLVKARYELMAGLDPRASLDRADEALERTLAINNDAARVWLDAADAKLMRAEWLLRRGRDPAVALAGARQYIGRVADLPAAESSRYLAAARAEIALLTARAAKARGADPGPALDEVDRAVAAHRSLAPNHPTGLYLQALSGYWRHRLTGESGLLSASLETVENLRKSRPRDANAWLLSARLGQAAGRPETDVRAALDEARALNPLLAAVEPHP